MISTQRSTTDDVSDCVHSQTDDVVTVAVDHRAQAAAAQLSGGGVMHATQPRHEDSISGRGQQTSLPLIAIYHGRTVEVRQSSANDDDVDRHQRCGSRRTVSLRRRLLRVDPSDLNYTEQVP